MNIVRATRTQTLKALSVNKTEYVSEEIFSGWAKSFIPIREVREGFRRQNDALKEFCERK